MSVCLICQHRGLRWKLSFKTHSVHSSCQHQFPINVEDVLLSWCFDLNWDKKILFNSKLCLDISTFICTLFFYFFSIFILFFCDLVNYDIHFIQCTYDACSCRWKWFSFCTCCATDIAITVCFSCFVFGVLCMHSENENIVQSKIRKRKKWFYLISERKMENKIKLWKVAFCKEDHCRNKHQPICDF